MNNLSGPVLSPSSLLLMFTVAHIIAVTKIVTVAHVTVTHVTVTHIVPHIITVYGPAQGLSIREYSFDK